MHAFRVLEYEAVLALLAEQCETALGAERGLALRPCFDEAGVLELLGETKEAYNLLANESLPSLGRVLDLRQTLNRAAKGGQLGAQELFQCADLLQALRAMRQTLEPRRESIPQLWELALVFPDVPRLEAAIFDSIETNGDVKDGASPTLASLRRKKLSAASRIIERVQSYVSGKSREYLSDPLYTVRDGRYVVPVKSEHRSKIRGIVHDTSGSGQTVYIEPEDVLQLGNALREIEGQEREEIQRILEELTAKLAPVAEDAMRAIDKAADLDLILAKARLAYAMKAGAPERAKAASIKFEGGRHPLLDPAIVVPVDLEVGTDFEGLLITGPNTGGKTVAIKCVGLFVLMAQSGLFLPARSVWFGPFRQVWADIGDEQSISQSLSTFSGHIKNIAEALKKVDQGSLVLFDEIGAGTDPAEGAALAKVLLREFKNKGARIVASTHYGELKAFAYSEPGFQNAAMEFDSKSLKPTYRLLMGAPGASHALKIAERYGIPSATIEQAKAALGEQQQDIADMLEKLELAQRRARQAQSEADKRTHELRQAEELANKKLAEADEIRRTVNQRATSQIEDVLREIRVQAADIFDELKRQGGSQKAIEEARAQIKALQSIGEEEVSKFKPKESRPSSAANAEVQKSPLVKGASVKVDGYTQTGTLLEDPKGANAVVQLGPLRLTVPVAKLTALAGPAQNSGPKSGASTRKTNLTFQKAQTATTEISLRGMRLEDAMLEFERFIDDAVLGGIHQVRIVHGKGEGILRQAVHKALKKNRDVDTFRLGDASEGGDGVTIATFK